MPDRHGKLAEVRPIFRRGDRVLVKVPFGYCEVTVLRYQVIGGQLWLHGTSAGSTMSFPIHKIRGRLAPNESLGWPGTTADDA